MKIAGVYQYLFKRNNQTIPYQLYAESQLSMPRSQNRIAYLASKAGTLFSLSVYYVVLYRSSRYLRLLRPRVPGFLRNPREVLLELARSSFSTKKTVLVLGKDLDGAQAVVLQKARSFILQVSDFLPVRILGQAGSLSGLEAHAQLRSAKARRGPAQARHVS